MYLANRYFSPRHFTRRYFGPSGVEVENCPPYAYTAAGRKGIGVVQPLAGTDFPLVAPTEDVRYLLADFCLSYDDPADYDPEVSAFAQPFRLAWLFGFGCLPTTIPAADESLGTSSSSAATFPPTPEHTQDLLVLDANDRVVFDSTQSTAFAERAWGSRLHLYLWESAGTTCRLVTHTAWSRNDNPTPRDYPVEFAPENGELDARGIHRSPKRVTAIRVLLDTVRDSAIEFHPGYNMAITASSPKARGLRSYRQIEFTATPGGGLGVYPGCVPTALYIRSINGQRPTPHGDFYLAATDCYYIRQPLLTDDETGDSRPATTLPPYDRVEEGLPAAEAGTSTSATGWPLIGDVNDGHLKFGNDCAPCCDCADYVEVGTDMNTLRDDYAGLGDTVSNSADEYRGARDAWAAVRECQLNQPLRLVLQAQFSPFIDVGLQLLNSTGACLRNVTLSVTLATAPAGGTAQVVTGYTFISNPQGGTDRYTISGAWPSFSAHWDSVPAHGNVSARFRLRFSNCGGVAGEHGFTAYAVTGTLTATLAGDPFLIPNGDTATAAATAVLNPPKSAKNTYSPRVCTTD